MCKLMKDEDYMRAFSDADSYLEFQMNVDLRGGNKAKMHKWLQKSWMDVETARYWVSYHRKLTLFIKEGINEGEIPMKFIWTMLRCPKNIDELKGADTPF